MKVLKLILSAALLLFVTNLAVAQKGVSLEQRAVNKVEEFNAQILAGDDTQALTAEQRTEMEAIFFQMFTDVREIRRGEGTDEEKDEAMKATRKQAFGTINREILTKEQRQAKRAGKEAKE